LKLKNFEKFQDINVNPKEKSKHLKKKQELKFFTKTIPELCIEFAPFWRYANRFSRGVQPHALLQTIAGTRLILGEKVTKGSRMYDSRKFHAGNHTSFSNLYGISFGCLAVIAALTFTTSALAAEDWQDPTIFGINKEPGRVTSQPYANRSQAIAGDATLWSERASCSAGTELMDNEVMVMVLGRSPDWAGPLRVAHAVMADAIDVSAGRRVLDTLGIAPEAAADSIVAVLAKAEASGDGLIRGRRHTMLDDSDVSSTRHARAFVGGALAGLVGSTALFVSGGAEHQGPDGGGPVAMIARTKP